MSEQTYYIAKRGPRSWQVMWQAGPEERRARDAADRLHPLEDWRESRSWHPETSERIVWRTVDYRGLRYDHGGRPYSRGW